MAEAKGLTNGFIAFMTRKGKLNYGIGVAADPDDSRSLLVTLTFRNGHRYCCSASACHHGLLFDLDYSRLRKCFEDAGATVPYPMKIRMSVVYEGGALFADNPGDPQPTYQPVLRGWACEEIYDEEKANR